MPYGVCKICGCTDTDPCHNPTHGNCWWVDDTQAKVLTVMPAFSEKTLLPSVAHSLTTMVPCVPNVRTTASTASLQANVI